MSRSQATVRWLRCLAALLVITGVVTGCLPADSEDFPPLPMGRLLREANADDAGEPVWPTAEQVEFGWPVDLPIPQFVDQNGMGANLTPGNRMATMSTQSEPDHDDVRAYFALLKRLGWQVDLDAATDRVLVRDGREWVSVSNQITAPFRTDYDPERDGPPGASGVSVTWSTNPARLSGYCRLIAAGGTDCLE